MVVLDKAWRKLTNTKALEKARGKLEHTFFETTYRIMYITGISSVDDDICYLVYRAIIRVVIGLLVLGEIWYAITLASGLDEIAAAINIVVIQLITIYRFRSMMCHKDMYRKLALSMESPYFDVSTEERQRLVEYWSQKNERFLKLILFLGNCTLAAWFLYPLVDDLEYNLFIGIRLPWSYQSSMYRYAFAYLLIVIAFGYISHFVMVNCLIMQAHLLHLVCQFAVLNDCFQNIVRDCQDNFKGIQLDTLIQDRNFINAYNKRLDDLVKQHRFILSNAMELRLALSGPMLGQLAASGILICFIGYQATTTGTENVTKCVMSLFYLCYNLFDFYTICRWCEEITGQSQRLGQAVYSSNWECGVSMYPGVRSNLMLIIARANKPLVFTAGGMYNISLVSYSSLVKTSYSALTVLLQSRHD